MRMLLVEDDLPHATLMRTVLRRFELEIEHVGTVSDAVRALAEPRRFELVVLDIHLPDGEGFEVHEFLNARQVELPVLYVSAEGGVEHAVRALQLGARGYVVKRQDYLERLASEVRDILTGDGGGEMTSRAQFDAAERRRLAAVLARHGWNVSAAARALGIGRGKLRSRIAALGMDE